MNKFVSSFVKLTGYPAVLAIFRTKYIYEDRSVQSRRIKGAAIIASNHTSVFDFAAIFHPATVKEKRQKSKNIKEFIASFGGSATVQPFFWLSATVIFVFGLVNF